MIDTSRLQRIIANCNAAKYIIDPHLLPVAKAIWREAQAEENSRLVARLEAMHKDSPGHNYFLVAANAIREGVSHE